MKIDDLLKRLDAVKSISDNQYVARCPAHDDNKPSLYISTGEDGRILLDCKAGCDTYVVVDSLGLKMSDLFTRDSKSKSKAPTYRDTPLREHIYFDEFNNIVCKKTLYSKSSGGKTAVWYRFDNRKFVKGLNGIKPPLYKLPELIASKEPTVFIVEGEKDVETMLRLGYSATSSPHGAGTPWRAERYNHFLRGRNIIIIADNDDPGEKAAENTAKGVISVAKTIKVIPSAAILSGLKHKGDVSDIVEQVGSDKAKSLIDAAVMRANLYVEKEHEELISPKLPEFIYLDSRDNRHINPALLAKVFRKNEHFKLVRDPLTDTANFYFYRNGVYLAVSDSTMRGFIKKYVTDFDESILKMKDIDEVLKNLSSDLTFITPDDLNQDEKIINFENGLLDLETMELSAHNPDITSSIQLPLRWNDSQAATPVFDKFLDELTSNDKETQQLLLEFIGAILSNINGYRFKKALFVSGKGDTGKSQLRNLVERILGSANSCSVDISDIESRFGLANIYGKRLAGCADSSFVRVEQLKRLKMLTGGDTLDIERKGKDKFSARFKGLLWFGTNELPRFGGDRGKWVYDRFIIVSCTNVISPEKRDKFLCDKMFAEREGIVYKALVALKNAIDNGYNFSIPESSKKLLKAYAEENSPVIRFFNECCIMRPEGKPEDSCSCKRMYDVFKAWCNDNNNGYSVPKGSFKKEIAEYLGKAPDEIVKRSASNNYYIFTLTLEAKHDYTRYYGYDSTVQ